MSFTAPMTEHVIKEKVAADQHVVDMQQVLNKRGANDFIYLAYGETWSLAPRQLQSLLSESELMDNGYQLSSWGRPKYREILHDYIFAQNRLPATCNWMVGWSSTGTRVRMFDFARLLKSTTSKKLTAIVALPSWDYQKVFGVNDFSMLNFDLTIDNAFLPNIEDFRTCLEQSCTAGEANHHVVTILNTQHNPTGVNWPEDFTREYLKLALEYRTSILIDDAYYAVHEKNDSATSALNILFELTRGAALEQPWIAVRSLGKQFNCNGWGLGAVIGQQNILEQMGDLHYNHSYGYGGVTQSAMSKWLTMPESQEYVNHFCEGLKEKKLFLKGFLSTHAGYPQELHYDSTCSPYYLLRVPEMFIGHEKPNHAFILELLDKCKIMLAPANMAAMETETHREWVRIYLGTSLNQIQEACARMSSYQWQ